MPPVSSRGTFGGSGESVLIEPKTEIIVSGRVGLGGEKIPDCGVALLDFFEEGREPTGELAAFGGEGGEPHLPVESGLERGDLGWESIGRAGFVGKEDGLPIESVGTAFEGEFGAASGHDRKESVARGEMPGSERILPCGLGGAGEKLESGKENRNSEGELEKGNERGEVAPGDGGPRKRDSVRLEKERPVAVMDEGKAEGDGEEIEKGVVPSSGDEEHEGEEAKRCGEADFGLGKEKGEREEEFDDKGEKGGELQKRVRELVDEPRERVGDGLGKEVVGHGGEVGPGGVAAEDFDDAGAEHETKEEEGEGEADE